MKNGPVQEDDELEWITVSLRGQHFRKLRSVRVGDRILTSQQKYNTGNDNNDNGNNNNNNQHHPSIFIPSEWQRFIRTLISLKHLGAVINQIQHYLYVSVRSIYKVEDIQYYLHLLSKGILDSSSSSDTHQFLSTGDINLIQNALQEELNRRGSPFKSQCDSSNRRQDRNRVQSTHFLPELGYKLCGIRFYNRKKTNELVATHYERVVYGDHGPYIEFNSEQINWQAFPLSKDKGQSIAYYVEHYTEDQSVKLYAQKKTVSDQPNPPDGPYSVSHNRKDTGYADYKIGMFYISPDDVMVGGVECHIQTDWPPYLYLLKQHTYDYRAKHRRHQIQNFSHKQKSIPRPTIKEDEEEEEEEEEKKEVGTIRPSISGSRMNKTNTYDDNRSAYPYTHVTESKASGSIRRPPIKSSTHSKFGDENFDENKTRIEDNDEVQSQTNLSEATYVSASTMNTQETFDNMSTIQTEPDEKFRVFQPRKLKINITPNPVIRTKMGKDVIKDCINGDYIPGLLYIPDMITEEEQEQIKQDLENNQHWWDESAIQNKRRSLQFGYTLDYGSMELYRSKGVLADIPKCFEYLAKRIQEYMQQHYGTECKPFNQLILNEYLPNQGIPHHTDRTHVFGPVVAGLSLFSTCVIEFKEKNGKNPAKPVLLFPRSVFVMTGPARYDWTHGIESSNQHKFFGHTIRRGVRYSMTFRHALPLGSEVLSRSSYNAVSAGAMNID